MIEAVLAVLIVTSVFLVLFRLSHMLTGKILLEHAAMRVARARTVGMNAFMCEKTARVAVMPVAGRRLWPDGDDFDHGVERGRVPIYLASPDPSVARGILEYEGWSRLDVRPGDGTDSRVELGFSLFGEGDGCGADTFSLEGQAGVEANCTYYMNDQGR